MRSRLRSKPTARTKKVSARCSDGRNHDFLADDEVSKVHVAPLPMHVEENRTTVADGDNLDEIDQEEAMIAEGLVSTSTTRAPQQQSAYMTRHFNSAHVMGLSPIEEMKLAQGEFQARAATSMRSAGPAELMSVASVASSMVSIIHPDSNNSESKGAKDAGPVRRTSAVQALLTKFHPLGADKPAGPHIRHIHQNTVDRLPEDDIRRLSATFRKDVEAMTPQQALSFVEDAVKTENIIKQKANDRRVKKLPWYLIHPMGPFRRRWDIVSLCLLLYTATCTPLQLSFPTHLDMALLTKLDLFVDCFFLMDVCLNCVSTYEVRGRFERQLPRIMMRYLRSWLFMDLVASFPYNIVTLYIANVDDGLRLFKLLLLTRFLRILTRLEYSLLVKSTVSGLVKFFILVMMTSHFFSCGFYRLSVPNQVDGWVARHSLGNRTLYDKYVTCFYWSIMTMTTVGYGDGTLRGQRGRQAYQVVCRSDGSNNARAAVEHLCHGERRLDLWLWHHKCCVDGEQLEHGGHAVSAKDGLCEQVHGRARFAVGTAGRNPRVLFQHAHHGRLQAQKREQDLERNVGVATVQGRARDQRLGAEQDAVLRRRGPQLSHGARLVHEDGVHATARGGYHRRRDWRRNVFHLSRCSRSVESGHPSCCARRETILWGNGNLE
ncbi:hypothetical protein, variant 1 [Aphanomyces invadans]|uniref:Ion transport domain-containing protein n=1 Tax=Aphanomyces invadans TaxID=157072 RepID=A0A024UQP4_9STRA|nr:hypothetical protein, variant 1 [Aphanomyces invadans]ETW08776.1 hypothetical protein, variant 1 [Aphanomyces invadans]|eukprot:XP_008862581.1 hypothetical protein, variant 1 [Aphanomyces invadans]